MGLLSQQNVAPKWREKQGRRSPGLGLAAQHESVEDVLRTIVDRPLERRDFAHFGEIVRVGAATRVQLSAHSAADEFVIYKV